MNINENGFVFRIAGNFLILSGFLVWLEIRLSKLFDDNYILYAPILLTTLYFLTKLTMHFSCKMAMLKRHMTFVLSVFLSLSLILLNIFERYSLVSDEQRKYSIIFLILVFTLIFYLVNNKVQLTSDDGILKKSKKD
jgi:hypothetical protein